jgi:hypothetical protein
VNPPPKMFGVPEIGVFGYWVMCCCIHISLRIKRCFEFTVVKWLEALLSVGVEMSR